MLGEMKTSRIMHGPVRCLRDGLLSGLAGGIVLAGVLLFARGLSPVGALLGEGSSPLAGFLILLLAAALGLVLWIFALLVIIPWLAGGSAVYPWTVRRASDAMPTLLAFLLAGLVLGRVYDWLQCRGCAE